MVSYFGSNSEALTIVVSREIVEDILGDLFFDSTEEGRAEAGLSIFKRRDDGNYEATRANTGLFKATVALVARGISFRAVPDVLEDVRESYSAPGMAGATHKIVASNVRIVCAAGLQILSDILRASWAFSIAADSSTHQGRSYLDIRLRVVVDGQLHNFHVLAIPLHGSHSSQSMFDVLDKVRGVVFVNLRTFK
jgi:hypothetical protein